MEHDSSRKRPLDDDNEGGVSKKSNQGGYESVHLKILVPSVAAGAVIGKGGETITQIQKEYDANIKMSKSQDYYPGTSERVCLVVGNADAVKAVHKFISERIREKPDPNPKPSEIDGKINHERHKQAKILVPNSTAGMIIGKGGNHIKEIKEQSGAYIQISQKSKDMNLPERCVTIAGELDDCQTAVEMIVQTIAEDPQSASCPNISYHDYRGPVASANPTGSPFAMGNRMENGSEGHMMQHPGQNMRGGPGPGNHGNNLPPMQGSRGNMPNAFNNLGNGMHNLNLNGGGNAANMATMSAVETMRGTLRGSGYTDHAIEDIIAAVITLANYGLFGFSLNLGGLGLQQNQQGMGMLSNLASIVSGHHGGGMQGHMGQGGNMMNPAQRGAGDGNPQIFGPVGSTTTTKAGGDTGEVAGSFYANAGGTNDPRNAGESWGPRFQHGGGNQGSSFSGMNQNSFGLGTGMGGDNNAGNEESGTKEIEVGEHIVGAILGPGGKGIVDIQNYTGANVQISKKGVFAPGTRNRVVTINGNPQAIHNAEHVIRQRISQEERSRSARQ